MKTFSTIRNVFIQKYPDRRSRELIAIAPRCSLPQCSTGRLVNRPNLAIEALGSEDYGRRCCIIEGARLQLTGAWLRHAARSGKLSGFDIFWDRYPHYPEDIEARCQM